MPKSVLEETYNEINTGGLSILSEAAKDRIKLLLRLCMDDGYKRGGDDMKQLLKEGVVKK